MTKMTYTEEDILRYKINEEVLVDGKPDVIRDIYIRAVRKTDRIGEEFIDNHLSYRILGKTHWYEEISPDRIQKLEGKVLGE